MNSMKHAAALAAVAALLLLAACGGGGGSPTASGSGSPGSPGPSEPSEPPGPSTGSEPSRPSSWTQALNDAATWNPAQTLAAIAETAAREPGYDNGSVYQVNSSARKTTATFDGSRVDVSVAHTVDFNSADDHLSDTPVSTPVAGHTGRSYGMIKETANSLSGAAVFVSWDSSDAADWLAGGYWMHVTGNIESGTFASANAGAFVDGPEFDDRTTNMPTSGAATYTGIAGGLYAYGDPAATVQVNEVLGTVKLTADFGAGNVGGSISGVGEGVGITLESTSYTNAGQITPGNVDLEVNGVAFNDAGKWGGRFSNKDDNGQPRLVAGTAGAAWTETDGNKGSFVGAFVASKQQE